MHASHPFTLTMNRLASRARTAAGSPTRAAAGTLLLPSRFTRPVLQRAASFWRGALPARDGRWVSAEPGRVRNRNGGGGLFCLGACRHRGSLGFPRGWVGVGWWTAHLATARWFGPGGCGMGPQLQVSVRPPPPFCAAGPTSPPQTVSGNHFSQFFFASEKLLRFLSLFFCTNMRGQFAVAEIQMMNGLTTFQA